jgi:hypothetical protein
MGVSIFVTAAMIRAFRHIYNKKTKGLTMAVVKNIDGPMLTRVWQELAYRIDVCLVTRGAHIDHL